MNEQSSQSEVINYYYRVGGVKNYFTECDISGSQKGWKKDSYYWDTSYW